MIRNRKIFRNLLNESNHPTASILTGPRQVGKTTTLNYLYDELCVKGKNKGIKLDLDIYSNYEKVSNYESAIATFKLAGYQEEEKKRFYVFFDEFQRYSNFSLILKNLLDHHKNIKIYATGSSSITIKDTIQESLAGRKRITHIFPLSFSEFLLFKNKPGLAELSGRAISLKGENLYSALRGLYEYMEEFLRYGGYPGVALSSNKEEKKEVLRSIFDLFVKKELVEYLKMDKILETKKIIQYLAVNNGQKTKYQNISQISGLSEKTVKHYIELLKEMYLIVEVKPYFSNKNKELVKIPKVYFLDTGVSNYFINNFNNLEIRNDAGFLFESFVLSELIKNNLDVDSIKYWQDKNGNEVDFVIDENNLSGLEVKYKKNIKKSDFSALQLFKKEYPRATAYLVNLSAQHVKEAINLVTPFILDKVTDKIVS